MSYTIKFEPTPHPDDIHVLSAGIMAYAKQQKGHEPLDFFSFFIRDEQNTIVGGCNGCNLYGCLYIDQLWLDASLRNQGYGSKLVHAAEQYGLDNGCTFAAVNTMDWEALGFYKKLGFVVEFERHGFQKDSVFYFLRKPLLQASSRANKQSIKIIPFIADKINMIVDQFAQHNWPKPCSMFELYFKEQEQNERVVWLAFNEQQFAGYCTLKWDSHYAPFKNKNIPEIMDLNVLPPYRNQGIGSALLDKAEQEAAKKSSIIGLGVGLYADYGSAQKLYIARGYMPDGLGLTYNYNRINPGEMTCLDDDLILWLTKTVNKPLALRHEAQHSLLTYI
jgi:GNAT superfamily N-acetyltransferase